MAKRSKQIEIQSAGENGYFFTFSLPGHKLFISKFYDTLADAAFAVCSIRSTDLSETSIRKRTSPTKEVYFVLYDSNGNPVGQSTTFNLVTHMELGINYFLKHFHDAEIIQPSLKAV